MRASPSTVTASPAKLERNLRRLQEFAAALSNWNGYGAMAFSRKLIAATSQILLDLGGLPQPFVSPLTDNGVQLDWVIGDRELEVEIYEDHFDWMDEQHVSYKVNRLDAVVSVVKEWYGS